MLPAFGYKRIAMPRERVLNCEKMAVNPQMCYGSKMFQPEGVHVALKRKISKRGMVRHRHYEVQSFKKLSKNFSYKFSRD